MRTSSHYLFALSIAACLTACGDDDDSNFNPVNPNPGPSDQLSATLVGHAVLPAASFSGGPTSGTRIGAGPINEQPVPFTGKQPVQGFSALLLEQAEGAGGNGVYLAMADNGFGSIESSADHNLRVYRIKPNFNGILGGDGSVAVLGYFELRDPGRHIPFTITNQFTNDRVLTGADFDIESMQRARDGSLWFGDEFGPFLLHTDAQGVLLEPPIELPDFDNPGETLRAPQNPFQEEATAIRIMNAVRRHAEQHGNERVPVFSPFEVMLDYDGADPSAHAGRGDNQVPGLGDAAGNVFSIQSLQRAGYPIVSWTVNDEDRMDELLDLGLEGIISDRPDLLLQAVAEFDANGDGTPGDYLTAEGLIDSEQFDAQGHRGARNLRPENTLPAMEAALDNLMTTLETDTGITRDGVPVLNHDPYIEPGKCRLESGETYDATSKVLVKDHTVAEIQTMFICDGVIRDGTPQTNDRTLSPVSMQFASDHGLADEYIMPTLGQLFDFVDAYIDYYELGAGMTHPDADKRYANAMKVRFNIETKLNPRSDVDALGNVFEQRTAAFRPFANAVAETIEGRNLEARADIQSFDFRTLLHVQERFPAIRTVYLFGDFPIVGGMGSGTNLQDEGGASSPWLAGMYWPYRETTRTRPFRVPGSGGFEGMAISPDGTTLYTLMEKPIDDSNALLIHEFDIATRQYTGVRHSYPLDSAPDAQFPTSHAIGDFIMIDATRGLVIERDWLEGTLDAYKKIHLVELSAEGGEVTKTELVDLIKISEPYGISIGQADDVGVGGSEFAFPFITIESVVLLDGRRIVVANDNNYPFSVGRHAASGLPDDNELIVLELPQTLLP